MRAMRRRSRRRRRTTINAIPSRSLASKMGLDPGARVRTMAGVGLRRAVKEVARRASAVARLQAELTKAELANTGKNAGIGAGLAAGAAFLAVFVFALLTTLLVVALALPLPLWLAVLIVLVVYLIVAAVLGLLARNHFAQAKGPRLAAEQAKLTVGALRGANEPAPTPALVNEPTSGVVATASVPVEGADASG